jgi:hypothetical protein
MFNLFALFQQLGDMMQESSIGSDDRSKSFRALVALVRNVQDRQSLQTNGAEVFLVENS